jgi:hypothetical protein
MMRAARRPYRLTPGGVLAPRSERRADQDNYISHVIASLRSGEWGWRSINPRERASHDRRHGIAPPGNNDDVATHVDAQHPEATAFTSVSAVPTNRFRSEGGGQALIRLPRAGQQYLPYERVEQALKDDRRLIERAGRAREGLIRGPIPQQDVHRLGLEFTGDAMIALGAAVQAPDGGIHAYHAALEEEAAKREASQAKRPGSGKAEKQAKKAERTATRAAKKTPNRDKRKEKDQSDGE